jgi:hypothetical protein
VAIEFYEKARRFIRWGRNLLRVENRLPVYHRRSQTGFAAASQETTAFGGKLSVWSKKVMVERKKKDEDEEKRADEAANAD